MSIRFIDYVSLHPRKEIKTALEREYSETLWRAGSLKGRLVCLLRVGIHAAGIVIKPLYYLTSALVNKLFMYVISKNPDLHVDGIDLQAFKNNTELKQRMISIWNGMILTAPFTILSQIIQVFKATLGIFHPGIYFKKDGLASHFRVLASVAKDVGCRQELIKKLEKGSEIVHTSLREFPHSQYYYGEYKKDLPILAEKLQDPEIPATRKLFVLSMLNPEEEGSEIKSGIDSCPPALGRTFQEMRANIEVPEDPMQVLLCLSVQFKIEIISKMVIMSEMTKADPNRPSWHTTIQRLAYDEAHRGNALISLIGRQVALPKEITLRAQQDPVAVRITPLPDEELRALIDAFNALYTKETLNAALLEKINSQKDGAPGLKTFRDQVIQILSTRVTQEMLREAKEQDEATYAVRHYCLSAGQGDLSEPGFNDLNLAAIEAFAQCH